MTTRAKLTLFSALATALVTLCLTPLVSPAGWVAQAFFLTAVTAAAGAGLRRLALPRRAVVPLQLVIVLYVLLLVFVQSSMSYGVLPGLRALDAVGSLLSDGGTDVQQYAIPAPATDGLRLILVGSVTLVAVVVDTLAVTFRRAAAAGLPLLALYSVGTGLSGGGGAWLWFLFGAAGYLLLLFAEGQDRLSRWGRVFHGTSQRASGTLSHSGHRVGLLALVCALILPAFIPHGDLGLVGGGAGHGGIGKGTGGLTSLNPVVALTDSLRRPDNVEMLRYATDSSGAREMYLRIAALDSFDGVQWKISEQRLQNVPDPLPDPQGLASGVSTTPVSTDIRISDNLSTEWLPMPYPADAVSVPGNWRYEPNTRALIGENGQRTKGLGYRVTSLDVEPSPDQLRRAGSPPPDITQRYLQLPQNLPPVVAETARRVTAGKSNPYDQAVALQNWFADGDFHYSLKVDAGTGNDAIVKFLQDKTGFCVHFAATMAAMARSLNIPARVAIGFAPGKEQSDRKFVVRSQDYHAWPELYFPGAGWLRFEPTPNLGSTPGYTVEQAAPSPSASAEQPTTAPSENASAAPSSSSSCAAQQRRLDNCPDDSPVAVRTVHQRPWWLSWQGLTSLAGGLVVLGLLATPMLWRARLRRRRLGVGRHLPGAPPAELTDRQVLAAWEELIDSAWDLGIPPDDARTPRGTARRIAETGQLDATASAAAGRLALATEQVLYAREVQPQLPLGPDVRTATDGLKAWAGRRGRARAVLLPASSIRLRWRIADRVAAVQDGFRARRTRVTERVGTMFRRLGRRG
ncbi:DUF3488 and transglutaminase-like domain-containing protein [Kitasatospora atroaurantiaca]|uniref:Transglutaminase-like putative cysteine protease n=1 Tax=Kitasatospora atroaurantiaca TaxID=285545 RepID=A0A561ELW0_9ACTN|nr:DUF3488 and transglutaminase-like domain-containing protein [Kitasatospora atroaurantiaca]TWE16608.1 transglutaminase-like putative cysteine protease [Kitasatospora atroaurantiaca]